MLFGTAHQSGSGRRTHPEVVHKDQSSGLLGVESLEVTEQIRGIGDNPGNP